MEILKLLFLICFCFDLSHSEESEKVSELQQVLEKIDLMEARMNSIETQMIKDQCECNLTDIEHQIRQNGITIAKVRHIVYLNDIRISQNIDEINDIETTVNAVEMDLEASINNVKVDLEASIDQAKSDLEGTIDSVKTELEQNLADLGTSINNNENSIKDLESIVNTQVIFSAIRKVGSEEYNNVNPGEGVTFTETITNIGNGMDPASGVFTCPVSGIYAFSLSAETNNEGFVTTIDVYKNDNFQFRITDLNLNNQKNHNNIGYSWTFSLEQGERVYLRMNGESSGLIVRPGVLVWFNGQLLLASK